MQPCASIASLYIFVTGKKKEEDDDDMKELQQWAS